MAEENPKRIKLDSETTETTERDEDSIKVAATDDVTEEQNILPTTSPDNNNDAPIDPADDPTLSKRQRKKLIKLKKFETRKHFMRIKEKERQKQKRVEAMARGEPRKGPSRKELKRNKVDQSAACKYTVAIDCSFNDSMTDLDINKCVKQLLRVYTINRRSPAPIKVHFTGITEGNRMHKVLDKNDGYRNWDVKISGESYSEKFETSKIVYLTSDSDNILEQLEEDKVYIIGGLVDHNHHKGLSLKTAQDAKIQHARLPLNENIVLKTRTVLSIFHVFEILLKVSEGKEWQTAMVETLPARKGAIPLSRDTSSSASASDEENEICNSTKNVDSTVIINADDSKS